MDPGFQGLVISNTTDFKGCFCVAVSSVALEAAHGKAVLATFTVRQPQ